LATASNDHTARLWDAQSGTEIAVLTGHTADVRSAAFSPEGRRLVTASDDHTARLWDAQSGTEIVVLTGHTEPVNSATFSPNGKRVVTASGYTRKVDGIRPPLEDAVRLWDAESGAEIAVLTGHTAAVWSAAFSPDGKRVVTAAEDATARLWDAESGAEIAVLTGHTNDVGCASFSPDGKRVVTSSDATVRLWDAQSGTEIAVLTEHTEHVSHASFSPDGRRVVTSSDATVRLWDVSRSEVAVRGRALVLTAALAQGIGSRSATEREDFLMQDAPDDMFSAALALLGDDRASALAETVAALHAPPHPNCYLSSIEFAAKFGLSPLAGVKRGASGWIYVGTLIDGQWNKSDSDPLEPALTIQTEKLPARGLTHLVTHNLHLRDRLPRQEDGFDRPVMSDSRGIINAGSRVKLDDVREIKLDGPSRIWVWGHATLVS
jgi:dipeptidyl aminopeptidase/acylaminoacyl peptidase